jgi:hypothetical protein
MRGYLLHYDDVAAVKYKETFTNLSPRGHLDSLVPRGHLDSLVFYSALAES